MFGPKYHHWHHWIMKVLIVLMWLSAIAFFWASFKEATVWGYEAGYYFQAVVVLALLIVASHMCCRGCGYGYMMKEGMPHKHEHGGMGM